MHSCRVAGRGSPGHTRKHLVSEAVENQKSCSVMRCKQLMKQESNYLTSHHITPSLTHSLTQHTPHLTSHHTTPHHTSLIIARRAHTTHSCIVTPHHTTPHHITDSFSITPFITHSLTTSLNLTLLSHLHHVTSRHVTSLTQHHTTHYILNQSIN
jgi:hypothetical protein